ncbi:MAG: hypothetical protein IJ899_20895 [Blautia sp.]|nr:hypothetical protein [Blautia sp.]
MEILQTIFGGLLGGGLIGLIEFLIRRKDEKEDKNSEILKAIESLERKVDCVEYKIDENDTVSKRVRILRFEDELQEGRRHSKDAWDQVMSDITGYCNFCSRNPGFKNDQTEATISHIRHGYEARLEKHDFL